MATFKQYTAGGGASEAFSITSFSSDEIKVRAAGVLKTAGTHYNITSYTTNGGTVTWISPHAPSAGTTVRFYRVTDVSSAQATYSAGSSVKAGDLNNNQTQLLRSIEEENDQLIQTWDIEPDSVDGTLIKDDSINSEHYAAGSIDNEHMSADSINSDQYVDGSIDLVHLSNNSVDSSKIVDGSIVNADVNASAAIAGTKVSPAFGSQNISTTGTLAAGATNVTGNIGVSGTVDGRDVGADGSKLDGIETSATADQTAAEIRTLVESASDSNVFTDADHSKLNAIEASATADQTAAEIRTLVESASDSNVFTDADHSKLNGIAAGASDDQTAAEIKTLLQSDKLTASEIATGALDGRYFTETELTGGALDGRYFTETEADARYFNISTGDTIKDGDAFPDNDTTIATTAAINDRIIDLVDDVGGFVPIANETSFPNANPDVNNGTGTLVSIKTLASNHTSNGSGVISISNGTVGNSTVTINGAANSTTYSAGYGMIVETTATLNTYTFHRLVPKATEVSTVAGKATEIGRLGTADAVADLALLGTTDVVADMNLLATAACVADMALLGDSAVIADMATIADTSNLIANIGTVAGIHANVTTVAGISANVTTVAGNITDVNNFADLYQIASSNPSADGGGNSLATGDLYFNTSANELKVWNGSAWQGGVTATGSFAVVTGNTFTGDNRYNDGVKALLGTGSDLEIFHTSDVNNIKSVNGKIVVETTAGNSDIEVTPHGSGVVKLDGLSWPTADGSANQVLQTNGSGVLSWGTVSVGGATGIDFNDNVETRWGTGNDLVIEHTAGNSWIKHGTTGSLIIKSETTGSDGIYIDADNIEFRNEAQNEVLLHADADGGVQLYYDNSKKFEVTSAGATVTGVLTATLAANSIDSDQYVDGSIDGAHIANDVIDSQHYAAGSIDHEHLANDIIDGDNIQDDVINSEHYAAGSIDNEHLADDAVGIAELSATGTASSSTYLRGDNTWATVSSGGVTSDARNNTVGGTGAGAAFNGTNDARNTLFGKDAGNDINTGTDNTCIGYNAGDALTSGLYNIAVGAGSLSAATDAQNNVAIGTSCLAACTGSDNVAIGKTAGTAIVGADRNIAIGTDALKDATGNDNIAIGYAAADASGFTGQESVIIGVNAGSALTGGQGDNVIIGKDCCQTGASGSANVVIGKDTYRYATGSNNVAVGTFALQDCTASNIVAIGYNALRENSSGVANTAVGNDALREIATGNWSTAVGYEALKNATGNSNTALGREALLDVVAGIENTGLGRDAGYNINSGGQNVCVGIAAGGNLTTGSNNTCIGSNTTASAADVSNEITLGNASVTKFRIPGINFVVKDTTATNDYVLTVDANGEAGWEAAAGGGLGSDGSDNTVGGEDAGAAFTSGSDNTIIGSHAGDAITSGTQNVCIGRNAGSAFTTQSHCVYIGKDSGQTATGAGNTAVGLDACRVASGGYNTCIGKSAGDALSSATDCTFVGRDAGGGVTTGSYNISIGAESMLGTCTGTANVNVGRDGLRAITSGQKNVNIGNDGNRTGTTTSYCVSVGHEALFNNTADNSVAIGYQALKANTTGNYNTALGYLALAVTDDNDNSTAVGYHALKANTTGYGNTAVGAGALQASTEGNRNVAIGHAAMRDGGAIGSDNVAVGFQALEDTTGANNVGIGKDALEKNTTGDGNTAVGRDAGDSLIDGDNNICIGYQADASASGVDNEITLGNYSISALRCQVTSISSLSDRRDKTDINTLDLGLDFINELKPVKFKWQSREGIGKDGTYEAGFIAQDFQQVQKDNDADYLQMVLESNPDRLEAAPGKLIPILVRAVQELSTELNTLKNTLNNE